MDGKNWNAAAAPGGEETAVDGADWRASLKAGSRERVVNKIVEILTRHLPFHGRDGFEELRKIAARYEQKIHTAATSQNDYVRRISLKMFTVENRSQSSMPSSFVYLPPKSPGNPGETVIIQPTYTNLSPFIEKEKLVRMSGFLEWERDLKISLKLDGKLNVIEGPLDQLSVEATPKEVKTHMLDGQRRRDRFALMQTIMNARLERGKPVEPFICAIIKKLKQIQLMGYKMDPELANDMILNSLHDDRLPFMMNYHMQGEVHDLDQMLNLLIAAEKDMKVEQSTSISNDVLVVNQVQKFKRKGNKRGLYLANNNVVVASEGKNTDASKKVEHCDECVYCKQRGYWMRNCPKYYEASTSKGTKKK